ncbi:MAG: hypothetical protein KJ658_05150 [Proteobacteria bacterium]|nr:hypothetical protein [Desulfobacula sp.]MBU3951505.1 hypothetical protein [Pseudomonadota bacterium]
MYFPNKPKPITATPNVPALSGFKGSITPQIKASADLTRVFFQMPYDQNNGIVQPLLCKATNHFIKNGISLENLSAASITFLALHSVRLWYPLPIILQSDDHQAVYHLLDICKQIAPEGSFIEVQELSWEPLYENQDKFRGKVIICTTPNGCKKAVSDLQSLIINRQASRQVPYKSSMGNGFKPYRIKYPVGFIGVETTDEKNVLDHSAILKIHLSSNQDPGSYDVIGYDTFEQPTKEDLRETHRIQTIFGRLRPCKVQVPFMDQISSDLRRQQLTDYIFKFNMIQNMVSLLSITNNPSLITSEELIDGYIRFCHPSATIETIIATKVEYAQMAQLLRWNIPVKDKHFTRPQIITFEAVKAMNLGKLTGSTIDQKNKIQVLSTLYKGNTYWAKLDDIFEKANSKGGKIISMQIIDRELNNLQRQGIIAKRKFPNKPDYGYYINTMSIGKHITFQKSSEIDDPKFNMAPVKVVNPLTGKIQTI